MDYRSGCSDESERRALVGVCPRYIVGVGSESRLAASSTKKFDCVSPATLQQTQPTALRHVPEHMRDSF
jgi:hypothetical protein